MREATRRLRPNPAALRGVRESYAVVQPVVGAATSRRAFPDATRVLGGGDDATYVGEVEHGVHYATGDEDDFADVFGVERDLVVVGAADPVEHLASVTEC